MNPFVADPEWGWWITLYFFLGGLAAGLYFVATLIDLVGHEEDRVLSRFGYRLALPLISVCGILLIVDLERPERFWHMLLQSEVVEEALDAGWPLGGWGTMLTAPFLKWWSPMSIGAVALGLFGFWSFVSLLSTIWPRGLLSRLLGLHWFGHGFRLIGSGIGFFVASYTGVLLGASNQPVWSLSDWIAPLFLASAASTALATMLLLARVSPATLERLERADLWALGLELFIFLIFLASLGGLLPLVLATWQGWVLIAGTLLAGLLIPLGLHGFCGRLGPGRETLAAFFALGGGFLLRFGVVGIAPALLRKFDEPAGFANPSLDALDKPLVQSAVGIGLIIITVLLAIAIPMLLHTQWRLSWPQTALPGAVSILVTAGVMFYAIRPTSERAVMPLVSAINLSPEEGRPRGGGVGASLFNRPAVIHPRSKIAKDGTP